MAETNNKPLTLLIAMNVILFMIIFWLIGLIMGKEDSAELARPAAIETPAETPVQELSGTARAPDQASGPATRQYAEPVQAEPQPAAQPLDVTIEDAVNAPDTNQPVVEPELAEPALVETVRNIDVYYDGELVRMEESDNHGNSHVVISNSLKEVDKIAPQDASYVAALRELKSGNRKHVSVTQVTRETAEQVRARTQAANDAVDRFNKVDVSERPEPESSGRHVSLADRIDSIVGEDAPVKPREADADYAKASLQDYVRELETESAERANEMRTIRVRRGDSLWKIAVRAYGNGFDYPRIYKANPHLRDPDMIREGETLRVPL